MRIRSYRENAAAASGLPASLLDSAAGPADFFNLLSMLELENARLREIICDLLRKNELLRTRLGAYPFES